MCRSPSLGISADGTAAGLCGRHTEWARYFGSLAFGNSINDNMIRLNVAVWRAIKSGTRSLITAGCIEGLVGGGTW